VQNIPLVLFSDDDLAVVLKPAGMLSTPSFVRVGTADSFEVSLQEILQDSLKRAVHLPSRLDRGVSGLLIASLSERMNRYAQKAHERRWFKKFYCAQLLKNPPWEYLSIISPIGTIQGQLQRTTDISSADSIFQSAATEVRVLTFGEETFALVRPLTGRTHQIRVHLADCGSAVSGDFLYGEESDGLRLVSYGLQFYHPYRRSELFFEIPLDALPVWLPRQVSEKINGIINSFKNEKHE